MKVHYDTVLLGDNDNKLERLVQEFGSVCQRRKLSVNETKSKITKIGKNVEEYGANISLNDRRMEEVSTACGKLTRRNHVCHDCHY